jgi:hypothetical protein
LIFNCGLSSGFQALFKEVQAGYGSEGIPIEHGVVVMDANPKRSSSVLFWVVTVVILGALVALGSYVVSILAPLFFPV